MKRGLAIGCTGALVAIGIFGWNMEDPAKTAVLWGWGLSVSIGLINFLSIAAALSKSFKRFLGILVCGILLRFIGLLGGGFILVKFHKIALVPFITTIMGCFILYQCIEIFYALYRVELQKGSSNELAG